MALRLLVAGAVIELLLLARVWAQLTGEAIQGYRVLVFDATDILVSPFRAYETVSLPRETGVLEFSTLVAMEAYLVLTLAGAIVLFAAQWYGGLILRRLRERREEQALLAEGPISSR